MFAEARPRNPFIKKELFDSKYFKDLKPLQAVSKRGSQVQSYEAVWLKFSRDDATPVYVQKSHLTWHLSMPPCDSTVWLSTQEEFLILLPFHFFYELQQLYSSKLPVKTEKRNDIMNKYDYLLQELKEFYNKLNSLQ
jgi:hypothetical protein